MKDFPSVFVPHALGYGLCYLWEKYSQCSGGQLPPAFNRSHWYALWRPTHYSNAHLKRMLGWTPRVSTTEALQRYFTAVDREGLCLDRYCGVRQDRRRPCCADRAVAGCEIVGVCDREPLMAEQLCDRFAVGGCYSDVAQLLEHARPEVVHITTPPESHFGLARLCLEHDRHVYVEKPFTLYAHGGRATHGLGREQRA